MTAFDPVKYKETTREQWQQAAEAWHRWGPTLASWFGPATEIMLDLARIGPGSRVLDVAAGAGEPAITIAERVGPSETNASALHRPLAAAEDRLPSRESPGRPLSIKSEGQSSPHRPE